MIPRIVGESLARRRRRKLLSLAAITLGIAVATVVATIAVDVGDKVSHELQAVGANIEVTPAADAYPVSVGGVDFRPAGTGAYLNESDLPAMKKIFWRNSIEAFAPFVYAPASSAGHRFVLIGTWFDEDLPIGPSETFRTGVRQLHPAWKVQGRWPEAGSGNECLVGASLAAAMGLRAGQRMDVSSGSGPLASKVFYISGILDTGGIEDEEVLATLSTVQKMTGLEGKVRRVEVSAMTKPDDSLSRIPVTRMTPDEYEKWSCSNYAVTVAYQIQQAIPGSAAKPVYRVSETEGSVLHRLGLLMALLAVAALITAALAVSSMMVASVLERRQEIGLFKALGATDAKVAVIFLTEACSVGFAGGIIGYGLGSVLAERMSRVVFGSPVGIHWIILPGAVGLALIVTLAGAAWPLSRGLRMQAAVALRID
ncbi:MAG: ABC transporter permease [Acidobacteriota bacterium]|nr:ABC transporter permease [Acidobacteriota bacterium]